MMIRLPHPRLRRFGDIRHPSSTIRSRIALPHLTKLPARSGRMGEDGP
jgi:hypothetical protein